MISSYVVLLPVKVARVAWAQVFGYYDRLAASPSFNSTFSATLYQDSNKKAPRDTTDGVKNFVEE